MADKSFGIRELNLIGSSGTPTIESPNDINLNASTVAISTNLTVGNKVSVLSTGIVTSVSGVVTFYGDGAYLDGIDHTAIKDSDGNIKVQANGSGAVVTGILTANVEAGQLDVTGVSTFAEFAEFSSSVGIGTTNTSSVDSTNTKTLAVGIVTSYDSFNTNIVTDKIKLGYHNDIELHDGNPALQIVGVNSATSTLAISRYQADGNSPTLDFVKSRNATPGSNSIVRPGDELGKITFNGDDGISISNAGAEIKAVVGTTAGSDLTDMPGSLVFLTSPDDENTPKEALRIDYEQNVGIGTSIPKNPVTDQGVFLAVAGIVTAHKLYVGGAEVAGGVGETTPGGVDNQIQYNNSGAFGGSSQLTYNGTTLNISSQLDVTGVSTFSEAVDMEDEVSIGKTLTTASIKVSSLADNNIVVSGGEGELLNDDALSYNRTGNVLSLTGNLFLPNAGNHMGIGTALKLGPGTDSLSVWANGAQSGVRIWASASGSDNNDAIPLQVADTHGTEYFRVANTGNIGIGSIIPSEKLDVDGNITVSGGLNVTGVSTVGVVTGGTYYGDGSNLTGTNPNIGIRSDGVYVGTASTINFTTGNITVTDDIANVSVGSSVHFVGARVYFEDESTGGTAGIWYYVNQGWFNSTPSIDTHSFYNSSNGRFVIPAGVSKIRLTLNALKTSGGIVSNGWQVYKNGVHLTVPNGGFAYESETISGGSYPGYGDMGASAVTSILSCEEDDYFQLAQIVSDNTPTWSGTWQIEVIEGSLLGHYFASTNVTNADNITVQANNTADETVYPIFVDGATGTQGAESDTGFTYNPSSGTLSATIFNGSYGTGNTFVKLRSTTGPSDSGTNTFAGSGAGAALNGSSGDHNTFYGRSAGSVNDTGTNNAYFGSNAGGTNVDGSNNLCLGYQADTTTTSTSNEITLGNTDITKFRIPGLNYHNVAGKVGIGTEIPGTKLEINYDQGSDEVALRLVPRGSGSATCKTWDISEIDDNNGVLQIINQTNEYSALSIRGNTNRAYIGINTDNPVAAFSVVGDSSNAIIELKRANAIGGVDQAFGVVGWGGTTGNSVASIVCRSDGDDLGAYLQFRTTSDASGNHYNSGEERLRITSAGDVGIGTDNPVGAAATTNNTKVLAVGIVTAQTYYGDGSNLTGIGGGGGGETTESTGDFVGLIKEEVDITADKLSSNDDINLEDGMVHYFTTAETTTSTPNIRYNGSTTLTSKMTVGQVITVTIITESSGSSGSAFSSNIKIDDDAVTEEWLCATAPSSPAATSGYNVYTHTIIKKGSSGTTANDFLVLSTVANYD